MTVPFLTCSGCPGKSLLLFILGIAFPRKTISPSHYNSTGVIIIGWILFVWCKPYTFKSEYVLWRCVYSPDLAVASISGCLCNAVWARMVGVKDQHSDGKCNVCFRERPLSGLPHYPPIIYYSFHCSPITRNSILFSQATGWMMNIVWVVSKALTKCIKIG